MPAVPSVLVHFLKLNTGAVNTVLSESICSMETLINVTPLHYAEV